MSMFCKDPVQCSLALFLQSCGEGLGVREAGVTGWLPTEMWDHLGQSGCVEGIREFISSLSSTAVFFFIC